MRKILQIGWYGHRNTGDDILASTIAFGLNKYGGHEVCIPIYQSLVVSERRPPFVLGNVSKRFPGHRTLLKFWKKWQSDTLVFGGGSLFSEITSGGIYTLEHKLSLIRNWKKIKRSVWGVSVSVGPVISKQGAKILTEMLKEFDYLLVRDADSLDLVQELGGTAKLSFDPGVLLERVGLPRLNILPIHKNSDVKRIGISLCNIQEHNKASEENNRTREDYIITSLKSISQNMPLEVYLLEFSDNSLTGERKIWERIKDKLNDKMTITHISYCENPLLVYQKIKECDAVIVMRLHASILAYIGKIPQIMLAYHPKCYGFAKMAGYSEYMVTDANFNEPNHMASQVQHLLQYPNKYIANIPVEEAQADIVNALRIL